MGSGLFEPILSPLLLRVCSTILWAPFPTYMLPGPPGVSNPHPNPVHLPLVHCDLPPNCRIQNQGLLATEHLHSAAQCSGYGVHGRSWCLKLKLID